MRRTQLVVAGRETLLKHQVWAVVSQKHQLNACISQALTDLGTCNVLHVSVQGVHTWFGAGGLRLTCLPECRLRTQFLLLLSLVCELFLTLRPLALI